jgi:hypothetical protein
LTTSCRASTSSVNLFCCSRAVSRSTCITQSKEAHTVRPFPRQIQTLAYLEAIMEDVVFVMEMDARKPPTVG